MEVDLLQDGKYCLRFNEEPKVAKLQEHPIQVMLEGQSGELININPGKELRREWPRSKHAKADPKQERVLSLEALPEKFRGEHSFSRSPSRLNKTR